MTTLPLQNVSFVPKTYEGRNTYMRLKAGFIKSAEIPITFIQHEFSADGLTEYRKEYTFSGCDVRLAFEDGTIIDADEFDKVLNKPRMVIYATMNDNDVVTSGNMLVELNFFVNTKFGGRPELDAYTQLCQMLLNRDDFGGYWTQFGLLPLSTQTTDVKDGRIIDPDLAGRLILRSVLARFSVLGELYGAR